MERGRTEYGLERLVACFSDKPFRVEGKSHSPFVNSLAILGMALKVLDSWDSFVEKHRAYLDSRLVGTGLPHGVVRRVYLPWTELNASIPVNQTKNGETHKETSPPGPDYQWFFNKEIMRNNPKYPPRTPGQPDIDLAYGIFRDIMDGPVSGKDLPPEVMESGCGMFSRARDAQGRPRVGEGSVAGRSVLLKEEDSTLDELDVPARYDRTCDVSGIARVLERRNGSRAAQTFEQQRDAVPLPVTIEEWRATFAPF